MKLKILIGLSTLIFGSCVSIKTLVLEIEKPPVILLDSDIKNVTIVNNSALQPSDVGHKELAMGREINSRINVPNDSVDIILIENLRQELELSKIYDNVTAYEYPLRNDNDYLKEIVPDGEELRKIAKETQADAIIAISKMYLETTSDVIPTYDYEVDFLNILSLNIDCKLNIYSKTGEPINPNHEIEIVDTIYWYEGVSNGYVISPSIPGRENALKSGAMYLSEKINSMMSVKRESVPRIYYGDVKTANSFAERNKWNEAKNIWMKEFDNETKSNKKGRLASNIALGYELTDNINDALYWIEISTKQFSESQKTSVDKKHLKLAEEYKQHLLNRKEDFIILDKITEN